MVARMQVRLIANPNASGVQGALIDQVAARLARAGDVEVRLTERPGQATDLARAPGADVVVAMGGDGTANEVANGMPPAVLMGVVPAGASSVFARQLRLPRQTLPAAAVLAAAIAERRWRPVGLGSVNGRMFTFSAGMGLEAEATRIVDERRRQRADGRRPRDSAVVAAAGRVLWSDRLSMPERITVTAGSLYRMVITAVPFLLPLQFQLVFGWTPFLAGLMVAALFVGNLTIKPATTPLMRRFGIRRVLLVNGIASVGCFGLLALLRPGLPAVAIVVILYLSGALRSVGFTAYNSLAFSGVDGDDLTHANTLNASVQELAAGLGIAIAALLLSLMSSFPYVYLVLGGLLAVTLVETLILSRDAGSHVSG